MRSTGICGVFCLLGVAGMVSATAPPERPRSSARTARASHAGDFDRLVTEATQAKAAGQLDAAVDRYRKALALKPEWSEGRWALAALLYDLGHHAEAREHFRQVAAAHPQNGLPWAMTGLCDAGLREYDTALADLQKGRALGLSNPAVQSIALFQTALLLNRTGRPDAAFDVLREFAAHGEDGPPVLEAFGLALLRLRWMPDEIPADKRDMIQLAGRGGYRMARGRRTAIGRLALEELVSRYPSEPNVHYALGVYVAPDDPEAAIEEFRKELRSTPDHAPALIQIASLETRRGHAKEAIPLAERAVGLAPELPAARLALGRARLEDGDPERAIPELERAAALAPESPDVQFALARAYQRVGRADDATRARGEFLRLDRAQRERPGAPEPSADKEDDPPRRQSNQSGGPG